MDKTAIVITTIHLPKILDDIGKNIVQHDSPGVSILVIGDKKTPEGVREYCQEMSERHRIPIDYFGIEEQEKEFAEEKELLKLFPYNTPDRVILGGLIAYKRGCKRIIALDDDNFPTENDLVGFHSITGKDTRMMVIENELGWFNVHSALIEINNIPFYPRGFPWGQRNSKANEKAFHLFQHRVVVNQGLVLGDSDIDAISRLFYPIKAVGMIPEFGTQFALYPGVWSPFNYQNTCLFRDIIPIYYRPISTGRNADIWTAYLINKLAEHFNDVISFGQPLVTQIRNEHNLWKDLIDELPCDMATDKFVEILRNVELTKKTYLEALGELLDKAGESDELIINMFFEEYRKWYTIISKLLWIQK